MKIFWTWTEENIEYEYEEIQVEKQFESNQEKWQVALDIIENPEEFIIVSPIAWVDLEELDVSMKDWVLIISWERKKPLELYLNSSVLRVGEVFWWKFSRSIILPENLDLDNIKAVLEKNILLIRIPKLKFSWTSITVEKIED